MTALFILHSTVTLESMMARGGGGPQISPLIFNGSADTCVTSLCRKCGKNNSVRLIKRRALWWPCVRN